MAYGRTHVRADKVPDITTKEEDKKKFAKEWSKLIKSGGEGDEEPKPRKQESEELGFVAYDEYGLEDTNSADFLVRKLQMEEEAAAARRAERNMAPVASFEFSKNGSKTHRRKDGGYGNNAPVVSDDVSEMTRGSGFTGVSEILDGKAIIEDLERTY